MNAHNPATEKLNTDYLIIGAGAVGMAFADTLLSETNANISLERRLLICHIASAIGILWCQFQGAK